MATSGSITSIGIGSGLDAAGIINKLMQVESQNLNRLRTQSDGISTTLSTVGKLQAHVSALRDKANALVSPTLWTGTTATTSDAAAVKVSTGSNAPAGSYAVQVNRLASGQTVASGAFAARNTPLGAGTLTLELGRYAEDGVFSARSVGTPLTITLSAADSSLETVRDRINNAGAGVVAGIVQDANGARLTLRSRETGAESAFRITTTETTDDGNAATGLSALAYDAGVADSPMRRTVTAANAEAEVNGIPVSAATNTLDNVVEGLTLNLAKTTTVPVQVEVAADAAAIKTAITDFVSAFNTVGSYIRTQTAYNEESKIGGPLQGDQGVLALQSQLRGVLNEASSASGVFGRLSDIGLALKTDGTLETKATKLDSALGNLPELRKLLVADGNSSADSGFVRRFKRLSDATLGVQGLFDARTSSLRQRVSSLDKAQSAEEQRLQAVESRLKRQYTALDTTMSGLSALGNYVTQQIAQMNKS